MSAPIAYDPRQVTLTVFGKNITGYGAGSITLTPNGPLATISVGIQGDRALTKSPDRSATLSFSLQQNAADNAYMCELVNASDISKVWLTDSCSLRVGTDGAPITCILRDVSILTRPTLSYGADQEDTVWELTVGECDYVGNETAGASVIQAIASAATAVDSIKKLFNIFKR